MERNKPIYRLILALALVKSGFGDDHPMNPARQCSNDRTIMSVMKETFETVMIESNFISLNQKMELIETKMTTCSQTLEQNALAAIANHDALIQKLGTNQDDLTSRIDSMHDLIEGQDQKLDNIKMTTTNQEDLTGRLDSLQDLVEDQRDMITNQTHTIERQNELIARQTEMLTTISNRIKIANFLEDCFVNCSLTIDNRVDSVAYNGLELAVFGILDDTVQENFFNFNSCDRYLPGALTIKGFDTSSSASVAVNHCYYGGLLLHCIANDIRNPWHNFVTDQTHWKVSDGSTPCTQDNEWISIHFKKMKDAGAIKIWSNAQSVTLIGKPDAH